MIDWEGKFRGMDGWMVMGFGGLGLIIRSLTTHWPLRSHWEMDKPSAEQTYSPKTQWKGAAMAAVARARMVVAICILTGMTRVEVEYRLMSTLLWWMCCCSETG